MHVFSNHLGIIRTSLILEAAPTFDRYTTSATQPRQDRRTRPKMSFLLVAFRTPRILISHSTRPYFTRQMASMTKPASYTSHIERTAGDLRDVVLL